MGSVAYFDKHGVRIKVCKIAYTFSHGLKSNMHLGDHAGKHVAMIMCADCAK